MATSSSDFDEEYELSGRGLEVRAQAAAFYIACLKAGYGAEAAEFAEWFLEEFDHDLED